MVRTGIALLVAALTLSWPGTGRDVSLKMEMMPVAIAGHTVQVSRHEVTVASWRQCYAEGGCSHLPASTSTSDQWPVTGVNWFDVNEYLSWANAHEGRSLRLPTLEEWRMIARTLAHEKPAPRFNDPRLAWAANYGQEIAPSGQPRAAGTFSMTPEGIADLDGNVWEWTSSCTQPGFGARCPAYVVAGEHEAAVSVFVRDPASGGCATGMPPTHLGFRLVSDHP